MNTNYLLATRIIVLPKFLLRRRNRKLLILYLISYRSTHFEYNHPLQYI